MSRPANFDAKHPIPTAMRLSDHEADEGLKVPEIAEAVGIDPEIATYAAEQRALRVILAARANSGGEKFRAPTRPTAVSLTDAEKQQLVILTSFYFDALVVGWRAADIERKREEAA